jgi:shikimate dehydrogenase
MRITGRTRLAGIMGWPVSHSRSPALHNFWLDQHGIDGVYVPLPVQPEQLERALRALPALGFRGCNITLPHKEAALSIVDRVDPPASRIGAVNTVIVMPDRSLEASNTDAFGFRENLRDCAPDWSPASGAAVVLGAGGSARAVVWALRHAGAADVAIWNRTPERARVLADALGGRPVDAPGPAEIVVNCTSVGLQVDDSPFKALPLDADSLGAGSLVVDLVYRDGGTQLLEAARERGADVVGGLEILVAQGAASFERWTGRTAPRQAMREAVGTIASP